MLTDASRRQFDVVMTWAIDRVGTVQKLKREMLKPEMESAA
jgi:hypothetical protein